MAATDRFMIAPLNSGLQTDTKPWLIPDSAFQELTNAYVYRGRVRKRFGAVNMNSLVSGVQAQISTRLQVQVGTTNGSGNFTGPVPGTVFAIGQMFSVGTQLFTVITSTPPYHMLSTGAATGTFNTSNGTVDILGAAATTAVYWYPSMPVTGFAQYNNQQIGNNPTFAFDPQFAYQFTGGAWARLSAEATTGAATWSGNASGSQLVWSYNWIAEFPYQPILYVTNYNYGATLATSDVIRYWDGTKWNFFSPVVSSLDENYLVVTSRIIVPFKNRLVLLNVVEQGGTAIGTTDASGNASGVVPGASGALGQIFNIGSVYFTVTATSGALTPSSGTGTGTFNTSTGAYTFTGAKPYTPIYWDGALEINVYVNRARWSWNGDPTATPAFYDNIDGLGDFLDAPTTEAIVTAQFLKDRLIVYFESSTWELVYTANEIQPFRWQQINTELGAQSTFSEIPFDKVVLGIGNVGVHACSGANVERIDDKIPEKVFEITAANDGLARVVGIRDYYTEQAYWTFPSETNDQVFPNRVLVYNYKTGSWAFFLDSFTAFGYYEQQPALTWEGDQDTWESSSQSWGSGSDKPQFKQVVAGNQQGFTAILESEYTYNQCTLYATNMVNSGGTTGGTLVTITCYAHNLVPAATYDGTGDYVYIQEVVGLLGVNDVIYPVYTTPDVNTFTIVVPEGTVVSGTYIGGGVISRISNINIVTKQYNFYVQDGRNSVINKVDFLFDNSSDGQITVDYSVSSSSDSLLTAGASTGTLVNTGIIETCPYQSTINIGSTDTSGAASGTVPPNYRNTSINFTVGTQYFIVVTVDGALFTYGSGTGTFNANTGAYTFTGCSPSVSIVVGQAAYPIETTQARLWHPIYPFAEGECIQLNLYMSNAQMINPSVSFAPFVLHAMTFYTNPSSSRLQ